MLCTHTHEMIGKQANRIWDRSSVKEPEMEQQHKKKLIQI